MRKLKQYHQLKSIGSGRFGTVYSGYDSITKVKVAIKELKNVEMAKYEAEVLKHNHSNFFPAFYHFFMFRNKAYIVMEYITGNVLGKYPYKDGIKRGHSNSIQITINILQAIKTLHQTGFIHGDIAPQNIIMRDEEPDTVKIIDFGSGRRIQSKNDIQEDLKKIAWLCIFLLTGKFELKGITNDYLKSLLTKAIFPFSNEKNLSTDDFIDELIVFKKLFIK